MIKILAAYYERNISEYKIAKNAGKWQSIVNIAAHPEKKKKVHHWAPYEHEKKRCNKWKACQS